MSRSARGLARFALVCGLALLLTAALAAPALADTAASCTTDTATSYCEQVSSGTDADPFMAGFGLAEAGLGAIFAIYALSWVIKRALEATGG